MLCTTDVRRGLGKKAGAPPPVPWKPGWGVERRSFPAPLAHPSRDAVADRGTSNRVGETEGQMTERTGEEERPDPSQDGDVRGECHGWSIYFPLSRSTHNLPPQLASTGGEGGTTSDK